MADLDTLRTEVREAVGALAALFSFGPESPDSEYFRTIRAELLRLANENADYGKHAIEQYRRGVYWMDRAKEAEAELAAIKARIAEAPLEVVESLPGAVGPPWPRDHWIEVRMADPCACVGQGLIGKRVRLVVEE